MIFQKEILSTSLSKLILRYEIKERKKERKKERNEKKI